MRKEILVDAACPRCNLPINICHDIDIDVEPLTLSPDIRGEIKPVANVLVYKISSEDMKEFIMKKAHYYNKTVKVEVVPRYCERKRRHNYEPHRSYASLRIAFSERAIEKKYDHGWYTKIGENNANIMFQDTLFKRLVQLYQYDKKEIDMWLRNYKNLEELEEALGMTEAYINDLRMYSIPQRVTTVNNERWIIFAAAPDKVIADMFIEGKIGDEDKKDEKGNPFPPKKPAGKIIIKDIYPISKDVVEWVVHLYPHEIVLREDPHVRQIMLGEERAKR